MVLAFLPFLFLLASLGPADAAGAGIYRRWMQLAGWLAGDELVSAAAG